MPDLFGNFFFSNRLSLQLILIHHYPPNPFHLTLPLRQIQPLLIMLMLLEILMTFLKILLVPLTSQRYLVYGVGDCLGFSY